MYGLNIICSLAWDIKVRSTPNWMIRMVWVQRTNLSIKSVIKGNYVFIPDEVFHWGPLGISIIITVFPLYGIILFIFAENSIHFYLTQFSNSSQKPFIFTFVFFQPIHIMTINKSNFAQCNLSLLV